MTASWICSSHGTWNGTPNTVRAAAASGIRTVHRKSFRPRPTFFITTMAMARSRTLVRNLASPPRRAARLEWHSQITMTTGLQTYSSPTMACSNISFTTTATELSQKGLSKQVLDCPKMAGAYHNEGNGTFSYGSLVTGLGVLSSGSSGWGVGLEDFDNDGWKDLFVAQGHVLDNVEKIDPSLHYPELPMLAMNHTARFERAASGVTVPVAGRGAAFGDLNNAGWEDAVMTSLGVHLLVLINRGGKQHWLVISLRGTRSNRDGLGARVLVNGQTRFATIAGSYLSAGDKRLHFGLGPATTAKIEIAWPSGIHQTLNDVPADQFLDVREPGKP